MKKLTAGIFATLLAMVSVDGAYAAIASKGYVDDKVGEVQTTVAGKADSSTVTALAGRVDTAEGEIDTLQTEVAGKQAALGFTPENSANKTTTLSGTSTNAQYPSAKAVWDTIQAETTGIANESDVTDLKGRVSTLETASANHVVKNEEITGGTHTKITYDAKGLVTAGANLTADDIPEIPNTKVSGLGSLATKSSVATADIASKAVTKEKLADDIVTSLGKADTALQQASLNGYITKTAADAAYADIATETTANTASTNAQTALTNIGTLSQLTTEAKDNTVEAINEVAKEAADAQSTATGAQSAVDAVESKIGGYGDIVTHNASEFATADQGAKADTAVQPAAISDMLTKTEAGTTYYTKTSGDALAGRVTTAEGEIDAIQAEMDTMATSETVTNLTNRVTTAEGDITALETAVNDAESGLAATNAIADSALSTAQSAQSAAQAAQTAANSKLPTATYNSEVGTVTAGNMGTTATTVVTAIKEVAGEAAAAQSTASSANTAAGAAQKAAEAAQATANAAIPKPSGECSNPTAKCVLVSNGTNSFEWEVIARDGEGE